MYLPYLDLVAGCFPNTRMVIDRFHIIQHLNRELNELRIRMMNYLRFTQPQDYRKLKQQWGLVPKNRSKLDYTKYRTHCLYDQMVTEIMRRNLVVSLNSKPSRPNSWN
ncbi:transposase [Alkalibacterium sp. f15]|uniref:transposase n=1 Tax=Alkalibacterium sp. f15 TaxID=3414029 RepID=UPI003BF8FE8D